MHTLILLCVSLQISKFEELLRKKLSFTWDWAEVLSTPRTLGQTVNRVETYVPLWGEESIPGTESVIE